MEKASKGEPIVIHGNPERVKELVYIKDFVQAIVKAADSDLAGGFYNIAAKERVTLEQMIRGIVDVFSPADNRSEISYDRTQPDTLQTMLDMSKTQKELGYQPQYSYIDMLTRNTVHLDHSKRLMPITEYGSCRSPNTVHPDHQLPLNPITFGGGIL
jgi:UDP-glucose 4-epimerase